MDTKTDTRIRRILKNWVSKYHPPVDGRARLLSQAANTPRSKSRFSALIPRTEFNDYPINGSNANEWAPGAFAWFFEQSFQTCIQARV